MKIHIHDYFLGAYVLLWLKILIIKLLKRRDNNLHRWRDL